MGAGASPLQAWGPTYKHARHNPKSEGPQTRKLKANQEITAKEVRLVGTDGHHQVLPLAEALKAARDAKLDLVEVAGTAGSCPVLVPLRLSCYAVNVRCNPLFTRSRAPCHAWQLTSDIVPRKPDT